MICRIASLSTCYIFSNNKACARQLLGIKREAMRTLHMITFRCAAPLFERLEKLSIERELDRTSILKLALHYFLNRENVGGGES